MAILTLREKIRRIRRARRSGAIDASETFIQMAIVLQEVGRFRSSRPRPVLGDGSFAILDGDRFVNLGNNGIRFARAGNAMEK